MEKNLIIAFIFIAFTGCAISKTSKPVNTEDAELDKLVSLMHGRFSSELQSKADTNYFNISLIMTPIWRNRTDGKWLYVEQAVATKLDKPYRQRVYHLQHPSKNIYTSDIYTIKESLSFAGLQDDTAKENKLTYDLVDLKEGCTVTLKKHGDIYKGGTDAEIGRAHV